MPIKPNSFCDDAEQHDSTLSTPKPPRPEDGFAPDGLSMQDIQPAMGESQSKQPEPESIAEPAHPLARLSMTELSPTLQEAVQKAGWSNLMPVQALALPYLLAGRDIMVQSRTGSGKTGAFLLPALERLKPELAGCQCLILVPTRELALQVEHEAKTLLEGSGLKAAALYGGVGYAKQSDALRGGVQLVVGTPGRLLDHLLRRNFTLDNLTMLILDEADRMLSVGFYPDMKEIQRYLPKRRVPVHFFSATFPPQVLRVAKEFMPKPELLSLSHNQVHHIEAMDHFFYQCKTMEKDRVLARVIELESPSAAIIFCNTKANVHYLSAVLKGFGYNADELSADLSQNKREEVLSKLRRGDLRFLIATDVAARGIDIPELSHVILYEPPEDTESYIHRAGRTGRAGAGGTVISLVDIMEKMNLQRIAKQYKIDLIQRELPTEDTMAQVVSERLTTLLEKEQRALTGLQKERMKRFLPLAKHLVEDDEAISLLAMLLDTKYQSLLHSKLELAPEKPAQLQNNTPKRQNHNKSGGRHRSGKPKPASTQN